jgi:16S rRNA (uracil1498-N3)-methyltransferase
VIPPAAAHAFVTDLETVELSPDDAHHLFRVLRLRAGEAVTVSDGAGRWRPCRVSAAGALEAAGDIAVVAPPEPAVTIAFALTKGERPEWTVQKLTEVGVDRIVPMTTGHTVLRWDADRARRGVERFREVARAAAMQARLAWLPAVAEVTPIGDLLAADPAATALAHPGGEALSLARPTVLVGPEGGFTEAELAAAPARVDLGPTTLRAETAALAAGVRLCALRAAGS